MFPVLEIINQNAAENEALSYEGKAFKFDFENNQYLVKDGKLVEITQEESVKQFISWSLKTQITKFQIYPKDWGIDKDTFIGEKRLPQGFVNSELKRQIEEQLTKHPLINSITNFTHSKQNDKLTINFTVLTTFNSLPISEVI